MHSLETTSIYIGARPPSCGSSPECILKWKIKLKDESSLRLILNKFCKGKLKFLKAIGRNSEAELKGNGLFKMNVENHGGARF